MFQTNLSCQEEALANPPAGVCVREHFVIGVIILNGVRPFFDLDHCFVLCAFTLGEINNLSTHLYPNIQLVLLRSAQIKNTFYIPSESYRLILKIKIKQTVSL